MDKVFITAEIGINHNGDIEIAKKLINMAIRCDCDAVKFQKRTVDKVYTEEFLNGTRQSPWGTTQREQKLGLEFDSEYDEIDDYCKQNGIYWYASSWDVGSQLFLGKYNLNYNKVASKMITNEELLRTIAEEGKHTFISTGLNDEDAIYNAVDIFAQKGCPMTLMHCVMDYPCPLNKCNLSQIRELKEYGVPVGYSAHFPGVIDTSIAVALGAVAVEKHITLDRSSYGSDQSSSLEERGLHIMVRDARNIGSMM